MFRTRKQAMARCIPLILPLVLTCCTTADYADTPQSAQRAFMAQLGRLCDKAFAGRLVTNEAPDAAMVGMPMAMHVVDCDATSLRIPFHVAKADGSWDRSRTWVITRTATGLQLKHDHRHEDGSPDAVTMYGGDTAEMGSETRQSFLVDANSIALFRANGLHKSVTNIWTVEVTADRFAYELRRTGENARHFRVEFDLRTPIAVPPAPWG